MKNYSFYQFAMTVRGRKDDKGKLAEQIFEDLAFPRHENYFNELSEYIETHGDFTLSMSVFDDLYEEYTEWLKF
ncbi:YozE family protein [Staphylococcus pasteuri]|uniref:YozE family protein n=1 Tax=Staphylococcus pasteuri TaxID=45972 RepID=UPI000E699FAD|nr:YozE family protein [Staphylococcus pasteuri]MCT1925829.1 YozE family protein [Staphylococcus pasteuri]QQT11382.1 YozE family protein [Staphylococcus pasteuri]RIO54626.1 YozE family protein [Staphylococcus pasteuri]